MQDALYDVGYHIVKMASAKAEVRVAAAEQRAEAAIAAERQQALWRVSTLIQLAESLSAQLGVAAREAAQAQHELREARRQLAGMRADLIAARQAANLRVDLAREWEARRAAARDDALQRESLGPHVPEPRGR